MRQLGLRTEMKASELGRARKQGRGDASVRRIERCSDSDGRGAMSRKIGVTKQLES